MNTIKQVLAKWEQNKHVEPTIEQVAVNLTVHDMARIQALCELYPGYSREQFITELISAALDEVESSLPYIQGKNIIREDEFGDPIYEDVGKTPKFEELTKKYVEQLEKKYG